MMERRTLSRWCTEGVLSCALRRRRARRRSGWRDRRHRSRGATILECTVLDEEDAAAVRIDGRHDQRVGDGNGALACAELAGGPKADVAARSRPLKSQYALEAGVILFAPVQLELV